MYKNSFCHFGAPELKEKIGGFLAHGATGHAMTECLYRGCFSPIDGCRKRISDSIAWRRWQKNVLKFLYQKADGEFRVDNRQEFSEIDECIQPLRKTSGGLQAESG
jgi:hypothetical protein